MFGWLSKLMTVKRMTGRLNDSQCECQSRGIPVRKMTGSVTDSQEIDSQCEWQSIECRVNVYDSQWKWQSMWMTVKVKASQENASQENDM